MKLLVVTAAFGTGHNQVAAALAEAATREGHVAQVCDVLSASLPTLSFLLSRGFLRLLTTAPAIYRLAYRRAEIPGQLDGVKYGSLGALSRLMWSKLGPLLARVQPDAILCTHPIPLGALAVMRRQLRFRCPLVGVLTDFAPHSFWLHPGVDQYYVATREMAAIMVDQGVAPYQVHVTGIPIRGSFAEPTDRTAAAGALGLDPTRPTVLLMGGGLGMGPMREMVVEACRVPLPAQLLVVTGHNRRVFEQLQPLTAQAFRSEASVRLFGYVPQIHTLMAASDVLVSKAGAVTASEALAIGLPMLLLQPIPGHEERNQAALVAAGAARALRNPGEVAPALLRLLTDPHEGEAMRDAARLMGRADAAALVVRHVIGWCGKAVNRVPQGRECTA